MKKMSDYLYTLGATCALTLSVVLAQDQAPALAAPAAEAQPAAVQPPAAEAQPAAVEPPAGEMRAAPAVRPPPTLRRPTLTNVPSRLAAPPSAADETSGGGTNALGEAKAKTTSTALKFDNAPVDIIVAAYCEQTGKTALWAPDAPKANVTLKSQPDAKLTKEEYIEAIEVVLGMNGIALEPFGEKFIKVLPRKTIRTDGTLPVLMEGPEAGHPEKGRVVSQMIQLKAITAAEAQKALEGFKKPDGLFQIFERTNSILVTDTQENVNRMVEIVKFIDQPLMVLEEVFHRPIRFAKADDIKKRIEELVAESQKQTQAKEEIKASPTGAPGIIRTSSPPSLTSTRPLPPSLTRLGTPATQPAPVTPNEVLSALVSDADRGMIRGKVQIISDERTNQLIIITRAENMAFFDRIITVLDIETLPDVKVEVIRLEYADAEEVSTMLNDLIGNASAKKDEKAPSGAAKAPAAGAPEQPARSTSLAEAVAARSASRTETHDAGQPGKSKVGQLSKDNIKILSDKRINSLVVMASASDLETVREIVKSMDIQLKQVLIETVALEVSLGDALETGLDWVRRVKASGDDTMIGPDGTLVAAGDSGYRYGVGGGGGTKSSLMKNLFDMGTNAASGIATSGGAGIEYLATIKGLRLDAVVSAAKSDNFAKVLSSPVLLTVDNKEATIEATELKYMYKGMRYMGYSSGTSGYGGGSYEPDIEQRDVGLTVKVTPRISPSGNVVLTVEETFEDVLGSQTINGQDWPTITTRKLSADVSVSNGETVILGGLVKNAKSNNESGIPFLKDIPYVGKYLFGSVKTAESRSELLVFLTPYVINTPDDMLKEARRRKEYVNATDIWSKGWSDSKLADPVPSAEMKNRISLMDARIKEWTAYNEAVPTYEERLKTIQELRESSPKGLYATGSRSPEAASPGRGPEGEPPATLRSETSTTVLGPDGATKVTPGADPAADEEPEPLPPEAEAPRKSRWRWWWPFGKKDGG